MRSVDDQAPISNDQHRMINPIRAMAAHDAAVIVLKCSSHPDRYGDRLALHSSHELTFVALRDVPACGKGCDMMPSFDRVTGAVVMCVGVVSLGVDAMITDHVADGVARVAAAAIL